MSKVYTDFIHGVLMGVTSVTVTLPFGPCNLNINGFPMTFHSGVDMVPAVKVTPIEKARVKEIGSNATDGNYIVLQHGDDTESTFKHLVTGSILNKVGDIVDRGQAIATSGRTGNTSGAHCHFGIRVNGVLVDPIPYLQGIKKITPYLDMTLDRPTLPVLRILVTDLYYRDKPNGTRIKYLEKKEYPYTGRSKLIGGHIWAEIIVNDGTREFGYCALNPDWNTLIDIEPKIVEKVVEVEKPINSVMNDGRIEVTVKSVSK